MDNWEEGSHITNIKISFQQPFWCPWYDSWMYCTYFYVVRNSVKTLLSLFLSIIFYPPPLSFSNNNYPSLRPTTFETLTRVNSGNTNSSSLSSC